MTSLRRQRGFTLIVGLIMLVLLTLIAVTAMRSTTAALQIISNNQFRNEATAAAQQAIDNVISSTAFMTTPPAPQNIDVNGDGSGDYTVTFSPPPSCLYVRKTTDEDTGVPKECTFSGSSLCYWTVWDITANVQDNLTNAKVTLHQGTRTIAGIKAALVYCGI
jgi:type II secretory pathway pseudopilin PulG